MISCTTIGSCSTIASLASGMARCPCEECLSFHSGQVAGRAEQRQAAHLCGGLVAEDAGGEVLQVGREPTVRMRLVHACQSERAVAVLVAEHVVQVPRNA